MRSCSATRVRNAASFRAYLLRVARNRLYTKLRRRDREIDEVGLSSLAELAPSPSAVASANERSALLLEALLHIPLELRLVLELHYWEACSAAEIADILGVPVGTIKTRIRRARQLTRQALERQGATPTEIEASMESVARAPRDLESLGS